ncbi:MAG: TlpA disulfide reductase family protein [Arcicella sp.]|nr:TlpA disulfide reductase family protein [Arcicella sp.]
MKTLIKLSMIFSLSVFSLSCKVDTAEPAVAPPATTPSTGGQTPPKADVVVDFTLSSDANTKIKLADYKDKVVVLFFFGSGCSSCKATSPSVQSTFVANYAGKNVEVIGLDTWDGNLAAVQSFRKLSNLTFPLLLEASSVAKTFETTYDRLVIVDKKGVVRFKGTQLAGNDIANAKKVVDEYLAK